MGYDMKGGIIEAGSKDYPIKWVSAQEQSVLSNMVMCLLPKFLMECEGNGALTPGLAIKCLVHTYSTDSGLDESVPTSMIMKRVAHYEGRYSYSSKAQLGVVYTGN